MIRWCAYCQTYQGECAPFDDFRFTHGICRPCVARGVVEDDGALARLQPIVDFYDRLRKEARLGFQTPPNRLLEEGNRLGVRPIELLLGLLQPALCEMADLWRCGQVPSDRGIRFSGLVAYFIEELAEHYPNPSSGRAGRPFEVLVLAAPGNRHALGPRLVELVLRSQGVSALSVAPGIPVSEARALVQALNPAVLGLSISAKVQSRAAVALGKALDETMGPGVPHRVMGGYAVKVGELPSPFPGWERMTDPFALAAYSRAASSAP